MPTLLRPLLCPLSLSTTGEDGRRRRILDKVGDLITQLGNEGSVAATKVTRLNEPSNERFDQLAVSFAEAVVILPV